MSRIPCCSTPSSPGRVLLAVALASFMVALDVTALNVALPAIGKALNTGMDGLQWIAGAYTLVFASLLLSAGALSDRYGALGVFSVALVEFVLASLACGIAPDLSYLIAARVAQGIGAAFMLPSSMALLAAAYPSPTERGRAMAVWGGVSACALVAGPVVGGGLIEWVGWKWIFFLNLPAGVVTLVAILWRPIRVPAVPRQADPFGQILCSGALGGFIFGLIEGPVLGWASWPIIGAFVGACLAGGLFVRWQRVTESPMLPSGLFVERSFCLWVGTSFFQTLAYYGSLFAIPIALQERGWSAVQVGAAMLPMTLVTGILATLSGWLSARLGSASLCSAGLFAAAMGSAVLASVEPSWSVMFGAGLLLGLGGATLPLIVSGCLCTVPSMRIGVGAGVLNTARQTGGVVGIAVLGLCLQGPQGTARAMALVMLAFLLAGGLVVLQRRLGMVAVLSDVN